MAFPGIKTISIPNFIQIRLVVTESIKCKQTVKPLLFWYYWIDESREVLLNNNHHHHQPEGIHCWTNSCPIILENLKERPLSIWIYQLPAFLMMSSNNSNSEHVFQISMKLISSYNKYLRPVMPSSRFALFETIRFFVLPRTLCFCCLYFLLLCFLLYVSNVRICLSLLCTGCLAE